MHIALLDKRQRWPARFDSPPTTIAAQSIQTPLLAASAPQAELPHARCCVRLDLGSEQTRGLRNRPDESDRGD